MSAGGGGRNSDVLRRDGPSGAAERGGNIAGCRRGENGRGTGDIGTKDDRSVAECVIVLHEEQFLIVKENNGTKKRGCEPLVDDTLKSSGRTSAILAECAKNF